MRIFFLFIITVLSFCSKVFGQENIPFLVADSLNYVYVNQRVSVELPETPKTGYTWHCMYLDSSYKAIFGKVSERLVPYTGVMSGDELHIFEFEALNEGKIIMFFELYKDWEGRDEVIRQKSFPVQVKIPEIVARGTGNVPSLHDWDDMINFQRFHAGIPTASSKKDNRFTKDQLFIIDLENRIEHATWSSKISNPQVIELVYDKEFSREELAFNMFNLHSFKFIARKPGEAEVQFFLILQDGTIIETSTVKYRLIVK